MGAVQRTATGQIITKEKKNYNERLFRKGWRRHLHEARFTWLAEKIAALGLQQPSILELGCFDAKTIDYLPTGFDRYVGYDADWEQGLSQGRQRWKDTPGVTLLESHAPSGFNPQNEVFDCTIAMETLEHLPLDQLDTYFQKLKAATRQYLFVTVPYEQGLPLLLKYSYKSLLRKVDEPYRAAELFRAVTGSPSKIERLEYGHKGFDYREFLQHLSQYFEVMEVSGLPFRFLPRQLNFSVAVVARPRN